MWMEVGGVKSYAFLRHLVKNARELIQLAAEALPRLITDKAVREAPSTV